MAVSSKEFLEEYATEHKLRGLSAARVASGERLFYILILGIYENKSLAEQAIADLPSPYDKYNPFLRSLKSLQQAMKRADDIAGSAAANLDDTWDEDSIYGLDSDVVSNYEPTP